MDMTILQPPPPLRGSVAALWELRGGAAGRYIGLPKPYVELIVSLSGQHRWFASAQADALPFECGWLTPVQTCPRFAETTGDLHLVGARLSPLASARLFGSAALQESAVPVSLDGILGDEALALRHRLHEVACAQARLALLGAWLAGRLAANEVPGWLPPTTAFAASGWRVDHLAQELGLSPRGLRKRFATQLGIGPKLWLQLGRFDAILRQATHAPSLAELAAEFGYADQAHLNVEFKRFAGQTPGAYQRARGQAAAPDDAPHFVPGAG